MSAALLGAYAFLAGFITHTNTPRESHYENSTLLEEYDFVIVGGGTAGCLLANKLSANPNVTVLVIEAGGVEDDVTEIPAFAPLQLRQKNDWANQIASQRNACQAMNQQSVTWSRGKVLGGTSVINWMIWTRANRYDFDDWQQGECGWSYNEMLPYFKSLENFTIAKYFEEEDKYHSQCGDLPVTETSNITEISNVFLQSCAELGYGENDYNGQNQTGCSRYQTVIHHGRRVSSSKAFIRDVVKLRPNLHVTLHSLATKIVFEGNKAVGVQYVRGDTNTTVKALKEIILSAGTIGSAHLLLLSGVGPKEELEKHKIPSVAELPVGKNLHDHVVIGGLAATTEKDIGPQSKSPLVFVQYAINATGPLALPPGATVFWFANSSLANASNPDIQITLVSGSPSAPETEVVQTKGYGLKQDVYKQYYLPNRGIPGFYAVFFMNRPKSRGELTLNTTSPHDQPLLDPKFLTDERDVQMAIDGYKLALRLMDTEALKEYGTKPWNISIEECKSHGNYSNDDYLGCLAKQITFGGHHFVGTCKMGTDEDAVVDHRLRVRGGVQNLRVVDASIMPSIVSGNVMATIYAIAAKGADMILEDNNINVTTQQTCGNSNTYQQ